MAAANVFFLKGIRDRVPCGDLLIHFGLVFIVISERGMYLHQRQPIIAGDLIGRLHMHGGGDSDGGDFNRRPRNARSPASYRWIGGDQVDANDPIH